VGEPWVHTYARGDLAEVSSKLATIMRAAARERSGEAGEAERAEGKDRIARLQWLLSAEVGFRSHV
jgi:hypothetical protein